MAELPHVRRLEQAISSLSSHYGDVLNKQTEVLEAMQERTIQQEFNIVELSRRLQEVEEALRKLEIDFRITQKELEVNMKMSIFEMSTEMEKRWKTRFADLQNRVQEVENKCVEEERMEEESVDDSKNKELEEMVQTLRYDINKVIEKQKELNIKNSVVEKEVVTGTQLARLEGQMSELRQYHLDVVKSLADSFGKRDLRGSTVLEENNGGGEVDDDGKSIRNAEVLSNEDESLGDVGLETENDDCYEEGNEPETQRKSKLEAENENDCKEQHEIEEQNCRGIEKEGPHSRDEGQKRHSDSISSENLVDNSSSAYSVHSRTSANDGVDAGRKEESKGLDPPDAENEERKKTVAKLLREVSQLAAQRQGGRAHDSHNLSASPRRHAEYVGKNSDDDVSVYKIDLDDLR